MLDCQPHTIPCWLSSPGDDGNAPAGLLHMVAMVYKRLPAPLKRPSRTELWAAKSPSSDGPPCVEAPEPSKCDNCCARGFGSEEQAGVQGLRYRGSVMRA